MPRPQHASVFTRGVPLTKAQVKIAMADFAQRIAIAYHSSEWLPVRIQTKAGEIVAAGLGNLRCSTGERCPGLVSHPEGRKHWCRTWWIKTGKHRGEDIDLRLDEKGMPLRCDQCRAGEK